jgi:hypothetical protein
LNEQGRDIIERHEEANKGRRKMEFICQKYGDKGIINTPDHTHSKKPEAQQKDFAIVEFHDASMLW